MNHSGQAIGAIKNYYNIQLENIVILHDDIDIPFGAVRLKIGGSSGGHNGLKSIDSHIGTDYMRVRIGVAEATKSDDTSAFVLSDLSVSQKNELQDIAMHIHECLNCWFATGDINKTKSLYTRKASAV